MRNPTTAPMTSSSRAMVRSLGVASALIRSDTVTSHTIENAMSPPRIAPAKSIARTPPVTARTRMIRAAAGTFVPVLAIRSSRLMTMPVRRANGQANPVNGAISPTAIAMMT